MDKEYGLRSRYVTHLLKIFWDYELGNMKKNFLGILLQIQFKVGKNRIRSNILITLMLFTVSLTNQTKFVSCNSQI